MGKKTTKVNSTRDLMNFEAAKPFIRSCLINESNLRKRQARTFVCADVWKTYFVELPSPKDRRTVCYIGEELLSRWNKAVDDLDQAAEENEQGSATIVNMAELLGNLGGNVKMYMVTNLEGWNGASVILNVSVQNQLSDLFPEGFAILPSSVHEVIAVPLGMARGAEIIVKTMNKSYMVAENELLSDHVFQVQKGRLTLLEQER